VGTSSSRREERGRRRNQFEQSGKREGEGEREIKRLFYFVEELQ
jgi:hypothetical protein